MKLLKRLRERMERSGDQRWGAIASDQVGFFVGSSRVEWTWPESIAAFKRDLITLDDVWFQLEGAGEPVMICEDQPGFTEWERELCARFPRVCGWREHVIQPAFAGNFTVLYRRT